MKVLIVAAAVFVAISGSSAQSLHLRANLDSTQVLANINNTVRAIESSVVAGIQSIETSISNSLNSLGIAGTLVAANVNLIAQAELMRIHAAFLNIYTELLTANSLLQGLITALQQQITPMLNLPNATACYQTFAPQIQTLFSATLGQLQTAAVNNENTLSTTLNSTLSSLKQNVISILNSATSIVTVS